MKESVFFDYRKIFGGCRWSLCAWLPPKRANATEEGTATGPKANRLSFPDLGHRAIDRKGCFWMEFKKKIGGPGQRSIHKTKYLVSQSSCFFFESWSKRMNETRIEKRWKGGQDETSRCAHLAQFPRHWVCPSRRSPLGKTAAVTWESRETIVRSLWQPAPALPSGQPGPAAHGFSSSSCLLLCTALSSPTPRITQT